MKKARVSFPDGSYVEWEDRESVKYVEEGKSIDVWVDYEPGFWSRGRVIKASGIRKWASSNSSDSNDIISEEKKKEIIEKVLDYYKSHKTPCRIE